MTAEYQGTAGLSDKSLADTLLRVRRDMINDNCAIDLITEIEVVISELRARLVEKAA